MSRTPTGLVFGHIGRYYLVLNGGLVLLFKTDQDAFRAIVLHELSHLRNGDVNKTYLTVSLWWAFLVMALLPALLYLLQEAFLDGWILFTSLLHSYRLPPLGYAWLSYLLPLIILSLSVYTVRNAVIQARETYADARASMWVPREELEHVLNKLRDSRSTWWSRLLRFHPDPRERQRLLHDPVGLFHMRFREAFGTGLILMIALPNIFYLLNELHLVKFELTESALLYLSFPSAALLLAPCIAGVLSLGVWRAALVRLRYGTRLCINLPLSLGFTLGMFSGQILSLPGISSGPYQQAAFLQMSFDILWGLLVLLILLCLSQWVVDSISAWLQVAASWPSPRRVYWIGFLIMGVVFAVWFSTFYWLRLDIPITSYPTTIGDWASILLKTVGHAEVSILFNPFMALSLICLWVYPLVGAFWQRKAARPIEIRWACMEPSQCLVLPPQPRFRLAFAIRMGIIGALAFGALSIMIRIVVHFVVPDAVRQSESFYIPYGVLMTVLAILLQTVIAARVTCSVHRACGPHGLFAAFVAGCLMTVEVAVISRLLFPIGTADLSTIWQASQTTFVLTTIGGALLAFLTVSSVSAFTAQKNGNAFQGTVITSEGDTSNVVSHPFLSLPRPPSGKLLFLVGLALLLMASSGMTAMLSAIRSDQNAVAANTAAQQLPYPPHHGTLTINDPLEDNTHGENWSELQQGGSGCRFTEGSYQVDVSQQAGIQLCMAYNTNFPNLAYQVQIRIMTHKEVGGILFRVDQTKLSFDEFVFGDDGSYGLFRFTGKGGTTQVVASGVSLTIHKGLNQSNLVAVVANGSMIDLYMNQQRLTSTRENILPGGSIGVVAFGVGKVSFSNLKVWVLPSPPVVPTATPHQLFPHIASSYTGTVNNTTANVSTSFSLSSIIEDQQGNISGEATVGTPLAGSGPFTGSVDTNNSIQFTVTANDGSGITIHFTGLVNTDNSLSGNYVTSNSQTGTWHVRWLCCKNAGALVHSASIQEQQRRSLHEPAESVQMASF